MVTDTEDRDSDDDNIVMAPLIYPEDSNNEESLSNPPSAEPALEPGTPSEKPTEEPTSENYSDALPETYAPTREDPMGPLSLKYIAR